MLKTQEDFGGMWIFVDDMKKEDVRREIANLGL